MQRHTLAESIDPHVAQTEGTQILVTFRDTVLMAEGKSHLDEVLCVCYFSSTHTHTRTELTIVSSSGILAQPGERNMAL